VYADTAAVIRTANLVAAATSDNARAMTLPTYVLLERFKAVVAAANERLSQVSDGRYVLEHVEERDAGRRSGLGLLVRDTHTEQSRDPRTLSGGETFYCSLALALGLADVVTAEAGGIDLGTLFVDEGFATLDPDTLEQVLGVLSGLRSGGRVVGIVSHVPELNERISERVVVRRNADGSSRLDVVA
jgi:exonuclease SbcC